MFGLGQSGQLRKTSVVGCARKYALIANKITSCNFAEFSLPQCGLCKDLTNILTRNNKFVTIDRSK